jgi:geranylgeranyl reductase family protein
VTADRSSRPGDVLVVGGGPAGLYAAQLLARRGLAVRVLEEHEQVGEPVHCTGILGVEALALAGVPQDAVIGWPRAGRFHSPGGHTLTYTGPAGDVCIVDRAAFDQGLARAAAEAGADVRVGSLAVDLRVKSGRVEVQTSACGRLDTVAARVTLLACGASYRLQRRLGWGTPTLLLSAAQAEFPSTGDDRLDVFFRRELAPTGFGWLVPLRRGGESRAKVGLMAAGPHRRALADLVNELTEAGKITAPAGRMVTRPLPLGPLTRTYGDGVIAIGDAAGLVKPTTGGGIYYSLLSARWAAETVLAAFARGEFSARALAGYEQRWKAHLGRELALGGLFRRLAGWLTANDLDALMHLAMSDGLRPLVEATARFN